MPLLSFQPIIARWFAERFGPPTEAQARGWPSILRHEDTLIAAPTGSGKTLAAFLGCLDRLVRDALSGDLSETTRVVYVSPLKALSNDIQRNLETPLAEIRERIHREGLSLPEIRVLVRTGDTPQADRQRMLRHPPHILVTTPESLYLLLTSDSGRRMLRSVETVIVDEIHAVARDKRGSHLALSLERLEHLCERRPVRIGLSATQRPIEEMARFLVGNRGIDPANQPRCAIVDTGHLREMDLAVQTPTSPLSAVCSNDQWKEVYEEIAKAIALHRSTLIFVNTRRLAERVTHHLSEILGEEAVASHHGSLSKKLRLHAEARLKAGEIKAVVATASLELGIDIGFIDLVVQIGSPRAIATFLQRIGRSGHALGVKPKGRLFALTRDEFLECAALVRAVRAGRLDRIEVPKGPVDILAQQMVAAAACEEWDEEALWNCLSGAYPYRDWSREAFSRVVEMLSEGFAGRRGRRGAYLYRDRIHRRLKARRGARLTALTCGGAIPDLADYKVVAEPDQVVVGSVDEDFAVESLAGDIFLLGNTSWRIRQVRSGEVVVSDAHGAAPTIPFWRGEAPSRTFELSQEVSALREEVDGRLGDPKGASTWLSEASSLSYDRAAEAVAYCQAQKEAVGMIPTQGHLLIERFFDESGGMQLVLHAPFGGRVMRAWGLALRKRFCRRFDFELQASADDNGLVLSLGPQQGFPLEEVSQMVSSDRGEAVLRQALLASPFFTTRWRWNATRALAVLRQRGGRKVPPPLQRFQADDLLSAVFPAVTACPDNGFYAGEIDIPDHPLVQQTVYDVLHEALDLEGWLAILKTLESGGIRVSCVDAREPSPFSYQLLNAQPYAFLDDAPLEERRARAVATRRTLSVESLRDLGRLDPDAIAEVRKEAWPLIRDADEMHDTLLSLGIVPEDEVNLRQNGRVVEARKWLEDLTASGRAVRARDPDGRIFWAPVELWSLACAARPELQLDPLLPPTSSDPSELGRAEAILEWIRGWVEVLGPTTAPTIAERLGLSADSVETSLEVLEREGLVLRGRFTPSAVDDPEAPREWCARHLLARIHRLTLDRLRRRMAPLSVEALFRFLLVWHHLGSARRLQGKAGLLALIERLQGFEAPASAWESSLLPLRLARYDPRWLDELCLSGEVVWGRMRPGTARGANRHLPISLMLREEMGWLRTVDRDATEPIGSDPERVHQVLQRYGALFFSELLSETGLLPSQLESSLWELVALGRVSGDGFQAIRSLTSTLRHEPDRHPRRRRRAGRTIHAARPGNGRWWLIRSPEQRAGEDRQRTDPGADVLDPWARQLLERYGVFFRELLTREGAAPPWRLLLPVFRRMEARGEIRGGRFIQGVGGEQYALPEAVDFLRRLESESQEESLLLLSAVDPMNLVGVILPGPKVPALASNAVAFWKGRYAGHRQGGEIRIDPDLDPETVPRVMRALKRGSSDLEEGRGAPLRPSSRPETLRLF